MNKGFQLIFLILNSIKSVSAIMNVLDFPPWLQNKTGLTEWPTTYPPPYFYDKSHNPSLIRSSILRQNGECPYPSEESNKDCSYDCFKCTCAQDITTCRSLSQSFDDGPSIYTPSLLDALSKTKTKTTFFLIGQNIIKHPQIVQREYKEGHTIAVHTWSHRFLPSLTNEEVYAELQWGIWAIQAATGFKPKYFRPPYGGLDNRIRDIATQLGLKTVIWSFDTSDWMIPEGKQTSEKVIQEVLDIMKTSPTKRRYNGRKTPKGLLLEHDIEPETVEVAIKLRNKIGNKQRPL